MKKNFEKQFPKPDFISKIPGKLSLAWRQTILLDVDSTWVRDHAYGLSSVFAVIAFSTKLGTLFFIDRVPRPSLFVMNTILGSICVVIFAATVAREGLLWSSENGANETSTPPSDSLPAEDEQSSSAGSPFVDFIMVTVR